MNLISSIKQHKVAAAFVIIAVALVSITIANRIKSNAIGQIGAKTPSVSLVPVSGYRQTKTVNIDNGLVQSMGQADLKSQLSAQIVSVNAKLGDTVSAGQILVQLQNNDISAQLDQAVARLNELKKGARAEDVQLSLTSAEETKTALINSIKDSYAKSDDAIHNRADKFFANPRQSNVEFLIVADTAAGKATFQASDPELAIAAGKQKYALEKIIADWRASIDALNDQSGAESIENSLALSKTNLQKEIDFTNSMAPLVNNLSNDNAVYKQIIDGYKAEFSAARSTVSGALSALQGAETAWRAANQTLNIKLAGASAEQIKQAQAAVDALQATLAKTKIVSPISGKISYLSARAGELAAPGLLVATVVNPNALQVKAYVSESDLSAIAPGNPAIVGTNGAGIVSNISPAIDATARKAEVVIAVTKNPNPAAIVGQSTSVKIAANNNSGNETYLLPIQAIQFTGNENYALTANQDQIIQRIPVTVGEIVGESVYVTLGLTPDMQIIPAVRGLKEGDRVKIQ